MFPPYFLRLCAASYPSRDFVNRGSNSGAEFRSFRRPCFRLNYDDDVQTGPSRDKEIALKKESRRGINQAICSRPCCRCNLRDFEEKQLATASESLADTPALAQRPPDFSQFFLVVPLWPRLKCAQNPTLFETAAFVVWLIASVIFLFVFSLSLCLQFQMLSYPLFFMEPWLERGFK